VAVYSCDGETIYYFDSYADEPEERIQKFLDKFKRIICNKKEYQSPISDVCGQYCIYFIHFMSLSCSCFQDMLRTLENSKYPDLFVKYFVDALINIY